MKITALNRVKIGMFLGILLATLIGGIVNKCRAKEGKYHRVRDIETRR